LTAGACGLRTWAPVSCDAVDEGFPIAYEVLDKGVPVLASDGVQVGSVHHVVAAPEKDIFHGLVITTPGQGRRFVEAAAVESLHERGVDLRIDSAAAQQLPEPGGGAPIYDEDPEEMKGWHHWVNKMTLRGDWHRDS
jgi:hypothetical protein